MNKKLVFSLSLIFWLFLTVFIYFSIENLLSPFYSVPISVIIIYIIIVLMIHGFHTIRWSTILKTTNHSISFLKLFVYRIMGFSLNYITPTAHVGGEPLKAAMLKENKVPYSEGVSSLMIDKAFEIVTDGFFAIIGIMIVILAFALPKDTLLQLAILSVLCAIILLWIFFNMLKRENALHSTYKKLRLDKIGFLKKIESGIKKTGDNIHNFFLKNTLAFKKSAAISIIMWILMFAEYKFLLLMLGFDATLLQLFVIISFVGIAYMIPIPAALGVLEVSQLTAFSLLGLDTGIGIAAAIIIRAKDLIITLLGLLMISIKGLGALRTIKETEEL